LSQQREVDAPALRAPLAELDVVLGDRIRHRRRARSMSLKDVAVQSGISIGLLSQIERGLSSPSLRVLASVADALNIGLGNLFDESLTPRSQREGDIVVRAGGRKRLGFWRTGISKELLTPSSGSSGLEIFMIVIEPGGTTGSQVYSHDGEEGGLVLEGSIAIVVDGEEHRLTAGDSFRFESTRPHSFWNLEQTPARIVWVNSHQRRPD